MGCTPGPPLGGSRAPLSAAWRREGEQFKLRVRSPKESELNLRGSRAPVIFGGTLDLDFGSTGRGSAANPGFAELQLRTERAGQRTACAWKLATGSLPSPPPTSSRQPCQAQGTSHGTSSQHRPREVGVGLMANLIQQHRYLPGQA